MTKRQTYSDTVVKSLFAMSRNVCGFQKVDTGRACEAALTHPDWKRVKAEIAHIRGLLPGSARHEPTFENPNDFYNLMLMCPNHHRQIDDLEPEKYTVQVLLEMKERGLERGQFNRLSPEDFASAAQQLIEQTIERDLADVLLVSQAEDDKRRVADAINRLPERDKVVLTLRYYEGLTDEEVGQVLGTSDSEVERYRVRALNALRDQGLRLRDNP